MTKRFQLVMFTGGRGTSTITEALLKHDQVSLTLLTNAYDDGLSTGALRRLIPGMLGPSDIRKNVSRLIDTSDSANRACQFLLEYRFPSPMDAAGARRTLDELASSSPSLSLKDLEAPYLELNIRQLRKISAYLRAFLRYYDEQAARGRAFEFSDCSLGNLLFAGCFLIRDRSFNAAIEEFSSLCALRGRVLNVTDGENLVLTALKENGAFLADEARIVSFQDAVAIQELFLLPAYLSEEERRTLGSLSKEAALDFLRARSTIARINPQAETALETADMIIYGPGTQHSSLFPSYLTEGLTEAIARNPAAEKIFVGNILKDYEIQNETASTLVQKFLFYLNRKGRDAHRWSDVVTLFFLQRTPNPSESSPDYIFFEPAQFPYPAERIVLTDWSAQKGTHSGGMIVDELVSVVNSKLQMKLKPFHHTVSILVPALDEERTVKKVLQDLLLLNLEPFGLGKEIILIDGGSQDHTVERARSVRDVRVLQLQGESGRGTAMRRGIEQASGDIVVFFPSDDEYQVGDLLQVIRAMAQGEFPVVFGSRLMKCVNLNKRILDMYQGNYLLYFSSKYGGMLVSIICLLLYNRFISDVFTGIKAFDARLLKGLRLSSTGLNLETEIIAKLGRRGVFILELPVDHRPRTRAEGKKLTVQDGLRALITLVASRWTAS